MEIVQIMDMCLVSMNCGFIYKGMVVLKRELILKKYMRSWLFIDILTSIPVYLICYPSDFKVLLHLPMNEVIKLDLSGETINSFGTYFYITV